jgi:hypothetical protein
MSPSCRSCSYTSSVSPKRQRAISCHCEGEMAPFPRLRCLLSASTSWRGIQALTYRSSNPEQEVGIALVQQWEDRELGISNTVTWRNIA